METQRLFLLKETVLMDISKGAFFMGLSDILMIRDRDEHEICWNEKVDP